MKFIFNIRNTHYTKYDLLKIFYTFLKIGYCKNMCCFLPIFLKVINRKQISKLYLLIFLNTHYITSICILLYIHLSMILKKTF